MVPFPTPLGAALAALVTFLVAGVAAGCDTRPAHDGGATGTVRLGLDGVASGVDDVVGVDYFIACEDGTTLSVYVPLEDEGLPPHIDPDQAGAAFADLFEVLPAGSCTVTATPMQSQFVPSADCAPASTQLDVVAGITTEITLTLLCDAPDTGGADVTTTLNHAPRVTGWVVAPDTTVEACTRVALRAEAEDADGDPLAFTFDVAPPAEDADFELTSEGDVVQLLAETPGVYTVSVAIHDGLVEAGASTEITVEDGPSGCLTP